MKTRTKCTSILTVVAPLIAALMVFPVTPALAGPCDGGQSNGPGADPLDHSVSAMASTVIASVAAAPGDGLTPIGVEIVVRNGCGHVLHGRPVTVTLVCGNEISAEAEGSASALDGTVSATLTAPEWIGPCVVKAYVHETLAGPFSAGSDSGPSKPVLTLLAAQPTVTLTEGMATIDIDSTDRTKLAAGFSGFNSESVGGVWEPWDPRWRDITRSLRPGWLRFPGGTPGDSYDWYSGVLPEAWRANVRPPDDPPPLDPIFGRQYGRGMFKIGDFWRFATSVGSQVRVVINALTDTPESAGALARYLARNHILVQHFELTNEPWKYLGDSHGPELVAFNTAADYANAMIPYATAIRSALPQARILLSGGPGNILFDPDNLYNDDLLAVVQANPELFNGASFHTYFDCPEFEPANGTVQTSVLNSMKYLNHDLDQLSVAYPFDVFAGKFQNASQLGPPDLLISEYGLWGGDDIFTPVSDTVAHGVFTAEVVTRLSTHPHIKGVGFHALHGAQGHQALNIKQVSTIQTNLRTAFINEMVQDTAVLDPEMMTFGVSRVGAALAVVNEAVNTSTEVWGTKVTGGGLAATRKRDGTYSTGWKDMQPIPALHAQAYRGANGKTYLVITNKTSLAHNVAIRQNGAALNPATGITKTWVSSSDPGYSNHGYDAPMPISSEPVTSPVHVEPWSVTRLEWSRKPPIVGLEHVGPVSADARDQSVRLQWKAVVGAEGYRIRYGAAPGDLPFARVVESSDATPPELVLTPLENGAPVFVVVSAFNAKAEGPPSKEISATPKAIQLYSDPGTVLLDKWDWTGCPEGVNECAVLLPVPVPYDNTVQVILTIPPSGRVGIVNRHHGGYYAAYYDTMDKRLHLVHEPLGEAGLMTSAPLHLLVGSRYRFRFVADGATLRGWVESEPVDSPASRRFVLGASFTAVSTPSLQTVDLLSCDEELEFIDCDKILGRPSAAGDPRPFDAIHWTQIGVYAEGLGGPPTVEDLQVTGP